MTNPAPAPISFTDFSRLVRLMVDRTANGPDPDILAHAELGVNEEIGECIGLIKKRVWKQRPLLGPVVIEEVGDALFYLGLYNSTIDYAVELVDGDFADLTPPLESLLTSVDLIALARGLARKHHVWLGCIQHRHVFQHDQNYRHETASLVNTLYRFSLPWCDSFSYLLTASLLKVNANYPFVIDKELIALGVLPPLNESYA